MQHNNKAKILGVLLLAIGMASTASAIQVTSCSDLTNLDLSGTNTLQNDIDCSGTTFSGTLNGELNGGYLNGNGYSISNLDIDGGSTGIFSLINEDPGQAYVENLDIINASISGDSGGVGIIASQIDGDVSDVTIKDSFVTATGNSFPTTMGSGYGSQGGETDLNNIVIENTRIEYTGAESNYGGIILTQQVGTPVDANSIDDIKVVDSELVSVQGTGDDLFAGGVFGSDLEGTATNVKVVNMSMSGFDDGDFIFGSAFGSDSYSDVIVAESTADDIRSGCTFTDTYVDGDTNSFSSSCGTTLTTSQMTGTSAETNMPGLDFANKWATQTGDYPALLFTLQPQVTGVTAPQDNANIDTNRATDFNFSINSGGSSATVELVLTYPNGTTNTIFSDSVSAGTSKSYNVQRSFQDLGDYQWYVSIGSDQSNPRNFTVLDYNTPTATQNSPVQTTIEDYGSSFNTDFNFNIDADLSGTYYLQTRQSGGTYTTEATGSYSTGNNTYSELGIDFTASTDPQDFDWRLVMEDSIGGNTTSADATFTYDELQPPTVSIERPVDGEQFYLEQGGSVDIPVEGWVNQSEEPGDAFGTFIETNVNYEENLGEINAGQNQYFTGSYTATQTATFNDFHIEARLDSGNTFESNQVDAEVILANPTISNLTANPQIQNAQAGDYFDLSTEGQVNRDSIDRVEYELFVNGVSQNTRTSNTVDFQDQNQWTDSYNDAFQMQQSWLGENILINATVYDTQGLTASTSISGTTAVAPDSFTLTSPDDGQVFLIPDGDTSTNVTFDYGIDTSSYSGTLELVLNNNVEQTHSIGSDTTSSFTYTKSFTESNNQWFLRWTDSRGDVYTSNTRTFDVTDEPVSLTLVDPTTGDVINIAAPDGDTAQSVGDDEVEVDHQFNIDSRAMGTDQHYYEWELSYDNGTVIDSRTSQNFDSGDDSRIEPYAPISTVDTFNWSIKVFRSSDDLQLESASTTYETVNNPTFGLNLITPNDGTTFTLDNGTTQRDVDVAFEVEAFTENVDTTVRLNGTQQDSFTTQAGNTQSYTTTLQDLTADTYNLLIEGEDASGRTKNVSATFTVEEADDNYTEPRIDQMEFRPTLSDADVGESVDLYIHGQGDPDNVDGVEVEINTGAGTEVITIPASQLQATGSWEVTVEDAITKTQEMAGSPFSLVGTVTDVFGSVYEFFTSGTVSESDLAAFPQSPVNNNTVFQPVGQADPVEFTFTANTLENDVRWEILAKHETDSDYTLVATEAEQDEDFIPAGKTGYEYNTFVNLSDTLNESRGNYKWKVFLQDSVNTSLEQESSTALFNIKDEGQTALNIESPTNTEYTLDANSDTATIPVEGEVRTNTQGTLEIDVIDDDIGSTVLSLPDVEVDGDTQFSDSLSLEEGTYLFDATYTDSQGNTTNEDFTFSVRESPTPENESSITLEEPSADRDRLYKNFQNTFSWTVYGNDESGNTTLYIQRQQNDGSWVNVETVTDQYDTQNEPVPYQFKWGTNVSIGDYRTFAEAELDTQTLTTDAVEFRVVDFRKPKITIFSPQGETFNTNETINLNFKAETFEDDIQGTVYVREEGDVSGTVVGSFTQDKSTVQDRTESVTEEAGSYEWYVKSDINPESTSDKGVFTSGLGSFTVEPATIPEPNFTLRNPEQGDLFEYGVNESNATVPFKFDTKVYSDNDANVSLRLEKVVDGNGQGYESVQSFLQDSQAGNVSRTVNSELSEAGYRYKVRVVYPNSEEYESKVVSFTVDDTETEDTPAVPATDDSPTYLERAEGFLLMLVGQQGKFFAAVALTLLASTAITIKAESEKLGMSTMILLALGFSAGGWLPSWIAVVFVLLAVGVTVFVTNRLLNATSGGG